MSKYVAVSLYFTGVGSMAYGLYLIGMPAFFVLGGYVLAKIAEVGRRPHEKSTP